jgi:hypothetical protein
MAELPAEQTTLAFFTPFAFDLARVQGVEGMEPNPDAIDQIGDITADIDPAFALPVAARGLTVVVRTNQQAQPLPHRWDGRWREAGTTQGYIPLSELDAGTQDPDSVSQVTKTHIMRLGRPVLEISVPHFREQLGPVLANTLTGAFQHTDRGWSAIGTLFDASRSLAINIRRIQAANQVRERGLEPFTIRWRA